MKKAVLILHGFAGSVKHYSNLIKFLQGDKIDTFIFTMPGHKEGEVCNVKYVDWVKKSELELNQLINSRYDDIIVLGHSMGAVIGTYLGVKYSEITRLILLAPAYGYLDLGDKIYKNFPQFANAKKEYANSKDLRHGLSKQFQLKALLEFCKLVKEYKKSIYNLDKPALYIHGKYDFIASQRESERAYKLNKSNSKTYILIDDATHDIFRSNSEYDLYSLIRDYVDENVANGYYTSLEKYYEGRILKK